MEQDTLTPSIGGSDGRELSVLSGTKWSGVKCIGGATEVSREAAGMDLARGGWSADKEVSWGSPDSPSRTQQPRVVKTV